MRSRWLLVLALILAVAGSMSLYVYLRQLDRRVPVVVAARDLARHEQLTGAEVRLAYIHPGAVMPGAYRSTADVAGKWVAKEILIGEQLTAARMEQGACPAGSYALGLAYRAFFIPCSYARGAGGAIWEGDHVDVIAVTPTRNEQAAYRIARDLEVLEVRDDQGMRVRAYGGAGGFGGVLVAVPDVLVDALALAVSCGQVYIILRDPVSTIEEASGF